MRTLVLSLLLPLAVVGCQKALPIAQVTSALATDPSITNGDVLAKRRAAGEDIPQLRGTALVTVRAYHHEIVKSGTPKKKEIAGARCNLQSDGYTAQVQTPGQVRVPNYGYASRLISVNCNAENHKTGYASVKAYDATKSSRLGAGASGGLIGVVAVEIINAADDVKNNEFEYSPAQVYMNRLGCENTKRGCRSN